MRRSLRLLPFLAPFLMAGKCKGKPVTDDGDVVGADTPASPEVELQLVSIEPDEVPPARGFSATVYGSGIDEGATLTLGGAVMPEVEVLGANALRVQVPPLTAGEYDVTVTNPDGEAATLHGALWVNPDYVDPASQAATCSHITVHFDFDADTLSPEARRILDAQAACIQSLGVPIRIEGHCDERGTTEYNLALGQRRADAVRSYLIARGVSPSRLRTISYGEEKPIAVGHDETAWAANRRSEIIAEM